MIRKTIALLLFSFVFLNCSSQKADVAVKPVDHSKNNYIDITLYEKFNIEDMYVGYSVYKSSWVSKLKVKNKNYKILQQHNKPLVAHS